MVEEGFQITDAGIIPIDWKEKKLSKVATFDNGKAHEQFIDDKGAYVVVNSKFISTEGAVRKYSNKNLCPLRKGDIAIVMSDIPNGRALAKCFLVDKDDYYTLNQRIGCIRAGDELHTEFLYYFLNRNKYFLSFDNGAGQTNLKKSEIEDCPVSYPFDKKEQENIASAISDADNLIKELQVLLTKKENTRLGAIQYMLQPKSDWSSMPIGKVFRFFSTASNSRADLSIDGNIGYIHYGDIHTKWKEFLDFDKSGTPFIHKSKIKAAEYLQEGDLILADASEDLEGLGSSIEIRNIRNRHVISGLHTMLLRGDKTLLADGFKGYFKYYHGLKDNLIKIATGVSVFGISKTLLKDIEITFPSSLDEQREISLVLDDMLQEIELLRQSIEKQKSLKEGLMQNLLIGKMRLLK